jgi:hypothetical protein
MKAKLVRNVKKLAAVATGALFVGATLGMASVFASGLSSLPGPFVSNGHVNAVFVVGANAAPSDILGAIDVSAALTAAAAATHSSTVSGQITIGTLSLSSKANSVNVFENNGTSLAIITPSVNLVATNFTSGGKNYTSVENLTFTKAATFNGLNVEFPAGSYELQSYIVNRSKNSNKNELGASIVPFTSFDTAANVTYAFGKDTESLLLLNSTQAQFGTTKTYSNIKVPGVVIQGPNSVDLEGLVTFTGSSSSSSYNQLEVSVNGSATQYVNFSTKTTIGPVTINLGPGVLTNITGSYLKTLTISSIAHKQNLSSSHVVVLPGLSSFNMTVSNSSEGGLFVLTSTAGFMLPHSFTAASNFELPQNLTSISLEKLVPVYKDGANVTLTVGKAGFDNITVKNATQTVDVASGVPNIAVGTGALYPAGSSADVPSEIVFGPIATGSTEVRLTNILANDTLLYSVNGNTADVASGVTGINKNVTVAFNSLSTAPAGVLGFAITNATGKANYTALAPTLNISTVPALVFYRLPNGEYLGLHYAKVSHTGTTGYSSDNLTYILSFNSSNTLTPTNTSVVYNTNGKFSKVYSGYNVSVKSFDIGAGVFGNVSIKAPVATLSLAGDSIVPGASGIFTSTGVENSVNVTSTAPAANIGTLTFNGSILKFTDLLGNTQTANVKAYSNGTTYLMSPTNTSANTWGDYATFKKLSVAFFVPTENYTLAVAGSEIVTGQKNYTIGQTVSTGELLNVSSVSTINAGSLINGNPDIAELDTTFNGATNSVPVIVMGGPAVNTLAGDLLNMTASTPLSQFINETGVHPNEAMIEMFNNVSEFKNQPALLVAGYYGNNTLEAAEVLSESLIGQPVVSLTGNKVILSTASSSYTGVTIVS